MAEYIGKPWGRMIKVQSVHGAQSKCWLGFMRKGGGTSIHRHSCDSVVSCVGGQIIVSYYGDGSEPDTNRPHREWVATGQSVEITKDVWHAIDYMEGDSYVSPEAVFHEWYDLKDGETDYHIERYEGAAS